MAYRHHSRMAALLRLSKGVPVTLRRQTCPPHTRRLSGTDSEISSTFSVPDTQSLLHAIAQCLASEGFGKEMIGARSEGMSARNLSAHGRDEHDWNSLRCRVTLKDLTNRKTVDVRQTYVEQDEIGRMAADEGKTVLSGFRGEDFEACFLQVILNEFDEVRFVVNHQNFGRHVRALAQEEREEQRRESESLVTKLRRSRGRKRQWPEWGRAGFKGEK